MWEKRFSIHWTITCTYLLTTLTILLIFSAYLSGVFEKNMYNQHRIEVMSKANVIAGVIAQNEFNTLGDNIERLLGQSNIHLEPESGDRLYAVNGDGRVVYDTNDTASTLMGKLLINEQVIGALRNESQYRLLSYDDEDAFTSVAVPIDKDGKVYGAVLLNVSAARITTQIKGIRFTMIWLTGVACVFVFICSGVVGGFIAHPIQRLVKNIKEISASGFRKKLRIRNRRGEVGELATEIDNLVDEMKRLEEKRREFVSNASHELKTPLSAIKLVCDSILENEYDPEMTQEFLCDMKDEVDRLTDIVNSLLTLTRMDTVSAEQAPMVTQNLRDIVDGVVASLKPLAEKRDITLSVETDNDVFMLMDRNKIWEAIYNIVDNSIKYTEKGFVRVYLEKAFDNALITITDTGVGISKEDIEKIFDRFYRVDPARSRETGGTGLGLAIARQATELHGGHIEVESEPGKGSTFRLFFPVV